MSKQQFDSLLEQQVAEFPKQKLPERDLWQGIEHALADAPAPNTFVAEQQSEPVEPKSNVVAIKDWLNPVSLAASFAFIGMFSWFVMQQQPQPTLGAELVAALSAQHEEQKNELLVKFDGQQAHTQNWQQQLTELDDAAAAIKTALEQDPDNVALLKMLQNVHQQQIDLIERVHAPKWRQI